MAQFSVNPHRFDPYKNYKFRVKWEGKYVAGVSEVSGLRRITEVVTYRAGGDPGMMRKSPGRTNYEPIILNRGVTHDIDFENLVYAQNETIKQLTNLVKSLESRLDILEEK